MDNPASVYRELHRVHDSEPDLNPTRFLTIHEEAARESIGSKMRYA